MISRHYLELEVYNVRPEDYEKLLAVLAAHFEGDGFNAYFKPTAHTPQAAFSGWLYVDAPRTTPKEEHFDLRRAIREALPAAQIETRWLNWEPIVWDAVFGISFNEEAEDATP